MAQWVHLPCKHECPCWNPQNSHKSWLCSMNAHSPSAPMGRWEAELEEHWETHCQLAWCTEPKKQQRDTAMSQGGMWRLTLRLSSDFHHTNTMTYVCQCSHSVTQTLHIYTKHNKDKWANHNQHLFLQQADRERPFYTRTLLCGKNNTLSIVASVVTTDTYYVCSHMCVSVYVPHSPAYTFMCESYDI